MRGVRPHGDQHTVITALDGAALRVGPARAQSLLKTSFMYHLEIF